MAITSRKRGAETAKPKTVQLFNTVGDGTWLKPEGCTYIHVQLCGGGGGAAGYWEAGGAGGYSETYVDVSDIESIDFFVGGGGGHVGYYGAAEDGGTTTFGKYLYATGGYGANRNHQHSGGRGGYGEGGMLNLNGGGGTGHCNSMSSGSGGLGGETYFGGAEADRRDSNSGDNGVGAPGTGGAGGRTNTGWGGTRGEAGAIVIHEYYS